VVHHCLTTWWHRIDPPDGATNITRVLHCLSEALKSVEMSWIELEESSCLWSVLVGFSQFQSGVHISGNHVHENGGGIVTYLLEESVIADNVIEDNDFYGLNLHFLTEDCRVSGNTITGNGARGLVLTRGANDNRITKNTVSENGLEGITLFLGVNTGNVIHDNVALDNGVWDLFHNATSTPNSWNDNTYGTASGDDID